MCEVAGKNDDSEIQSDLSEEESIYDEEELESDQSSNDTYFSLMEIKESVDHDEKDHIELQNGEHSNLTVTNQANCIKDLFKSAFLRPPIAVRSHYASMIQSNMAICKYLLKGGTGQRS